MPASFIPDPHKGPGNGIIIVTPLQCTAAPTFALVNASDKRCLTPEGWQTGEVFLEPVAWDCENDMLRLAVGPEVVDNLDSLDMYKLHVKDATGVVTTYNLAVDDIIQSSMAGGHGVGMAAPVAAAVVAAPVVEEPQVEPEPEPAPVPEPEPAPLPEVDMADNTPAKKSPLPLILGILLLCALLGGALWWYFTQYKDTTDTEPTTTEETEKDTGKDDADKEKKEEAPSDQNKAENDKPENDKSEEAKQEDNKPEEAKPEGNTGTDNSAPATNLSPMDSARELLRKNDAAQKSYDLAQNLKPQAEKDAKAQDAVFLLLEDAAQKGLSGAMTELGNFYDPSSTGAKGSISPDANEAYTWYTKAQESGDANVTASLERLQKWAEEEAKKGNAAAKDLLNSWKK